ncbi:hypothetical protein GCM10028822_00310 [Hymenobacter terrigena]
MCQALTINAGASLTVNGRLSIYGAAVNAGTFAVGGVGTSGLRIVTARNATTITNTGTLAINGTYENTGNFNFTNNGTVSSSDAGQLTFSNGLPITFSGSGTTGLSNVTFSNTVGATLTLSASLARFVDVRRLATIQSADVISNGKLRLTSDVNSTGMLYNNGSGIVTDNAVAQRYISTLYNRNSGYRHYASPVSGATFAMFENGTDFTAVCNSSYAYPTNNALKPYPTVFYYDESLVPATTTDPTPFSFGWLSVASKAQTMEDGRGYTVQIEATNATTGNPNTISLTGIPHTGDFLSPAYGRGGDPNNSGYNLVGNPYPGFIDMNAVMGDNLDNSTNQGFDGVVYKYHTTSMYSGSYQALYLNDTGTDSLNQFFPMMQGFLVRKTDNVGTASYQFHDTQRIGSFGYPTTNTTPFYRTTQPSPVTGIYLNLRNAKDSSLQDEIRVEFRSDATAGHDARYDAVRPGNNTGLTPTLFTVNPVGEECMRNGLPTLQGTVTVPVGMRTLQLGQSYVLQPAKLLQLSSGQVFLEDRQNGTLQDLTSQPQYVFKAQATTYEHRFFLRFVSTAGSSPIAGAKISPSLEVYPNPGRQGQAIQFSADGLGEGSATATLTTPYGKVVANQQFAIRNGLLLGTLPTNGLNPGLYLLQLTSLGKTTTQRIEIR